MSTAAVFLDDLIALLMVNKVIKNYQDQRNEVKKNVWLIPHFTIFLSRLIISQLQRM